MQKKTWLITGVSSGFGKELAKQALERGDAVVGTVRNTAKIGDLLETYPESFSYKIADMRNVADVRRITEEAFEEQGEIDCIVSNAGYGLYGAAEEFSDEEIDDVLATNLRGSIAFIQASLPYLRTQNHGHILQVSSVGGQVGYLGNAMYCATKFGIEGYCECVKLEMEPFHVKMTLVEPGGARTDFRYGGAKTTKNLMPEYEHAHGFLNMLDASKGLAPGDPVKIAARILECADTEQPPLHMSLGSKAWGETVDALSGRLDEFHALKDLAFSTDVEEDEQ